MPKMRFQSFFPLKTNPVKNGGLLIIPQGVLHMNILGNNRSLGSKKFEIPRIHFGVFLASFACCMASDDVAAQDQEACRRVSGRNPNKSHLFQAWDKKLRQLLLKLPTDGDEAKLSPVLTAIRTHVAARWCFLLQHGAEAGACKSFQNCVQDLAILHREEIPWAPFPPLSQELADANAGVHDEDADGPDPPAEPRSDQRVVPHEFRFMKVDKGVWTVLVAAWITLLPLRIRCLGSVMSMLVPQVPLGRGNGQGYQHYFSVSEWYTLKTPFSQWFTKNFSSMARPLATQLEIEHTHVQHSATCVCLHFQPEIFQF